MQQPVIKMDRGLKTEQQAAPQANQPTHREGAARLHPNRILASLPPYELALLAPHLQPVTLRPGIVLQSERLSLDHVYFPHEALLSLLVMTPGGETMETASAGRGGAVCPLLQSDWRDSLLSAVAQGPVRLSRVASKRLEPILRESETLARLLGACREALVLQLRQNVACSGLHAVEHRLARWLLEAADRIESDVVPVTQDEVAQRLGVRRTTVTLMSSKLQELHAIRWTRARVEILDRARLEHEACTCYTGLRERITSLLRPDLPPT
jgi:CRP-like cAMP-binding protein